MMSTESPRLDMAELGRALQAVDPSVLLVPSRILRRVIKHDRNLNVLGLQVPHPKTYVIDRQALLAIADPAELEVEPGRELPETVILIARPDSLKLGQMAAAEALVKFWRRLFHARVHIALEQRLKARQVTEAGIRQRVQQVGPTEFHEVRSVLLQENYLLPPQDDRSAYVEFAAVYLELRYFAAAHLRHYFPTLSRPEAIDALLAEDVDAAALFAATRPAGAPDPQALPVADLGEPEEEAPGPVEDEAAPLPEAAYNRLRRRALRAAGVGNVVRAALLETRAAAAAGRRGDEAAAAAGREVERLTGRLQQALGLSDTEATEWRQALPALLPAAARGSWGVEARLLYDLQKVCLDHERGVFSVNPVYWLLWLGRRPFKRPLPALRQVLAVKRLRKANRRLASVRLGEVERGRLAALLGGALVRAEGRLRVHFRPLITAAFDKVGLVPPNVPEDVARDKLVEELLDRIVEGGYLTMGDLRDGLSRNQLKLPDLSGPGEFFWGDPLLRLNDELAHSLDGVYHRGEVYLRWLQRFSSLAFGTNPGRLLTRYLAVPFGGAYMAVSFAEHLAHMAGFEGDLLLPLPPGVRPAARQILRDIGVPLHRQHLTEALQMAWTVGLLGVFLLLLFNVRPFRRALGRGLRLVGRGLRALLLDLPLWLVRLPPVRAFLDSRPVVLFRRHLLPSLLLTAVAAELSLVEGLDPTTTAVLSGCVFVVALVFFSSRLGRDFSESLTDSVARGWRRLSLDILPGLFRLTMNFFKRLLELVQRFLYTIDEWLRFRSGEGRLKLAAKAVAGVVWFFVTYVVRFAVNLLIEPQINPIKHFPVVTVSHKLVLPLIPVLAHYLRVTMEWDPAEAVTAATLTIWCIPGIFGFMVWELKENWFLFQANRPERLRPVVIGHHGETMLRLLKRGFHSGTVPKLHARLRRAEHRGRTAAARRQLEALQDVAGHVRHFVERELVNLLRKSRAWGGLPLEVCGVVLASNRIRVELCSQAAAAEGPLVLVFDEQQGWLLGSVGRAGWLGGLSGPQRRALAAALTGLYKMAAVALVRDQIRACLPAACCAYDLTRDQLVVWPDAHYETEVIYDLRDGPLLPPNPSVGVSSIPMPRLEADRLVFANVPLTWRRWVEAWEQDRAGDGLPEQQLPGVKVLPQPCAEGGK
jgi:hypothetical protein